LDWKRRFDDAVILPDGRKLVTLRDAALYITKLPKAEHGAAEWQAAIESLMLVAELRGPTMFVRIGIMRALNRHVERAFNPNRKDHDWGRTRGTSWRATDDDGEPGRKGSSNAAAPPLVHWTAAHCVSTSGAVFA
jgi:hypothetical protein